MATTPIVIFDVDADLLSALEAALGPPLDSYLMGWQVWLHEIDEQDVELEFRLHPPAGFEQPDGMSHHDLWDEVIVQVADGVADLELGSEHRTVGSLWQVLEVFPAFGEDVEPEQLRRWVEELLGREALGAGEVDHERLGGRWKRRGHEFDLASALRAAVADEEA
ncbi:MAG: hypothetical protein R3320_01985 [Nitriliruptorales bacterium]|nr:hypothetical protein [Nitriliruptorales bacterium]